MRYSCSVCGAWRKVCARPNRSCFIPIERNFDVPRSIEVVREELPEKLTVYVVGGNGGD